MSNADLILRLFLQLAVILAACRLVGMVGRRIGQAQVVCEMITGVLLGPSLFGLLLPHLQSALFPQNIIIGGVTITHPSMSILYVIAHLGLALYMFLVGLEFDTSLIHGRGRQAGSISASGILLPFVLGGFWLFTALIILIAIAGKGAACTLGARLVGNSWRESATVGVLMNARGLVELILLNIGLEAHIISPTLFTMLVLMAMGTTLLTTPLYQWFYGRRVERERAGSAQEEVSNSTAPVAIDIPQSRRAGEMLLGGAGESSVPPGRQSRQTANV